MLFRSPLLIGMGVTALSMTPSSILDVKARVRNLSLKACQKLAKKALQCHSGLDVAALVDAFLEKGDKAL